MITAEVLRNTIVGPPPPFIKVGFEFSKFSLKGEGDQIFPIKKGGIGKIGKLLLKKGITYFHTNPFQCYLSFSVLCVYFVYLHYTISISVIFVSQEELGLVASN